MLFGTWFASGIVMMYARMPRLAPGERLARLAPLDLSASTVSPREAASRHRIAGVDRLRVGMLDGRPIYRFFAGPSVVTIFADTGEALDRLTTAQALAEARRFAPDCAGSAAYDARIEEPDQWTLETRALLPMHRVALHGCADGVVYVSERTGEVVLRTTAPERRAAYAGAVLHWLYFTPLRRHGTLWSWVVILASAAGTLLCALGLIWGLYVGWRSPYRGWMRWHHYAGLAFGVVSLAWVFSGLLSMDPGDWHPSTSPTAAQARAFSGDWNAKALASWSAKALAERKAPAKEIEIWPFRGEPHISLDGEPQGAIAREALLAAAGEAMPGTPIVDAVQLDDYDSYYYDRSRELPLPVLRVRYSDPAATWLYVDARRGIVVRKEERLSRVNRWAYHGLHSLDFPPLYRRRPLWDIVVIVLSLGGLASVATAVVPAWRRLRRLV